MLRSFLVTLLAFFAGPIHAQRGARPAPRIEPRRIERPGLDGRDPYGRDPYGRDQRPRDFRDLPKAEQKTILKELIKLVQKDAQGEAAPRVGSFLREVKRPDWAFIQLYRWTPGTLDPSRLPFDPEVPLWRATDPFATSSTLSELLAQPNSNALRSRPRLEEPRLPFDELNDSSPTSLARSAMRAIVYAPGPQSTGTDVGTQTALTQAQGNARFALVQGAKGLADLKPLVGHVIVLPGEVSGHAIQRVMDTLDRFMSSFSDPKNWSEHPPASMRALLLVRSKQEEIVVNVNLTESSAQGRIVCSLIRTAGTIDAERQAFRERVTTLMKQHPGERVYVAGDALTFINVDEMARAEDIELVHRNLSHQRSMMATDQRLQDLHGRGLNPKTLTLINGLPSTPEAVDVLGPFAGDAEQWLQFHANVEAATAQVTTALVATKEGLFNELIVGQHDILILVAHADGTTVYLNGQAVSLAQLEALPRRTHVARRSRLAVLLSCYAGAPTRTVPEWRRWFSSRKQTASLGDIFVRKGFVDRVIAPKHAIRPEETIATLRKLLNGTPTRAKAFREGWVNLGAIRRAFGLAG